MVAVVVFFAAAYTVVFVALEVDVAAVVAVVRSVALLIEVVVGVL